MINTTELILFFSPDPVYAAGAGAVFSALGLRHRAVTPGEVAQTVGFLAGLPGQVASPRPLASPVLPEPMMVLCALSPQRMDQLFDAMRKAGTPPPSHKAILTPTNMGWTLAALYDELGREHETLHRTRNK